MEEGLLCGGSDLLDKVKIKNVCLLKGMVGGVSDFFFVLLWGFGIEK